MADDSTRQKVASGLVAQIVSSYVAQNSIAVDQVADLISTVHRSLSGLDESAPALARWCRRSRSGDRCSATMSSASNADIAARCCAGISASPMDLNPRRIARAGSCRLITRSPRRLIRSGVRRWQGRSASGDRRKLSCRRRLLKWLHRRRSGVVANRDQQQPSSSARRARINRSSINTWPRGFY